MHGTAGLRTGDSTKGTGNKGCKPDRQQPALFLWPQHQAAETLLVQNKHLLPAHGVCIAVRQACFLDTHGGFTNTIWYLRTASKFPCSLTHIC